MWYSSLCLWESRVLHLEEGQVEGVESGTGVTGVGEASVVGSGGGVMGAAEV